MRFRFLFLVLTLLASVVACQVSEPFDPSPELLNKLEATKNSGESNTSSNSLPAVDPIAVSGGLSMAGSSTVFPLAERLAERFEDDGFNGNIALDSVGSGGGFERFCVDGASDISNASRPIKDKEVVSCQEIGREPLEFRIGTDALAVVVGKENNFIEAVTTEELAEIFTAEKWSDVRPEWPDEEILRYVPGTDSGTFDYFIEVIFEKDIEPVLSTPNTEFSEDDNVLVEGVIGSPYAITFFGYAYYQENQNLLNILSVDGVEASQEAVDAGEYALSRPLYMYTTAKIMQEKPQVGAFLNYVLTHVNEEVVDVGYFPANPAVLDEAVSLWLDANP